MTTAQSIVNRSAEIIGYKDPDESLSSADSTNFFGVLGSMVDAWALDQLFIYARTMLTQSVSGNPITIGPSATINTARPNRIADGGFIRSGSTDYAFEVIGFEQYQAFRTKTTSSSFPRYCYYEATMPAGSLYFFPALASTCELHLPIEQRLTAFADLTTDYTLAPGYRAALEYSLAEELSPGRRPLDANVVRLAMKYRRNIENYLPGVMSTGFERKTGNILAGWQ